MTSAGKPQVPSNRRTPPRDPPSPSKSDLPHVAALFDKLDHGAAPNFLDVMLAIDEVVDFYTNPDLKGADREFENCKMSHNNCRFCS